MPAPSPPHPLLPLLCCCRVFDLLVNHLPLDVPGQQPPPPKPPASWRDSMYTRQATASVVLAWTRVSPEAFLPHLEALATRVGELWEQGRLRAGAHLLSDATPPHAPPLQGCCRYCLRVGIPLIHPHHTVPLLCVCPCAGEKNVLQEAIVGAVVQQPEQTQAQVVGWVLSGVRQEWLSPAWQGHLASPQAFMQHYTPVLPDGAGGWQVWGRRGGGDAAS